MFKGILYQVRYLEFNPKKEKKFSNLQLFSTDF